MYDVDGNSKLRYCKSNDFNWLFQTETRARVNNYVHVYFARGNDVLAALPTGDSKSWHWLTSVPVPFQVAAVTSQASPYQENMVCKCIQCSILLHQTPYHWSTQP